MLQAQEKIDSAIFDVEKNDLLARQIFHAYYRTPDPSGAIYRTFPEFFLVKQQLFDDALLAFNKHERPLIESYKRLSELRSGWVGITQYFDKKSSYHWIKYSVYPFMLGDADADYQDEFFYLLNQFVLFTQQNPTVYGDLTEDASSDNDVALMLAAIRRQASTMDKKLQYYPSTMLLSFDASWPSAQVKMLLAALEVNQQSWNHLFLEHLRYVMRKNKGLAKTHPVSRLTGTELASDALNPPSNTADSLAMPAIPSATVELDDSLDMVATLRMRAFTAPPLSTPVVSIHNNTEIVQPTRILGHWWQAAVLVNTIKLLSLAALLLASALSGFLFAQSQQRRVLPTASVGQVTQAANFPVLSSSAVPSEEYVVLENLRMSEDLTLVEPNKKP